ncbi:putative membrane protein [Methylophaga frappieri]|uniref:Putative membrane protein n=1 Tax=Methylophaga frappieri (strain ATCC BAA-2434 / DSM 25690 / JAM7) TaxID=754477 RepID=I1YFZ8_METFJ|nr:DUF202 domain-containing protein [Methylophaga frappieri]AFJ01841.1 putative membrane protein [Methylophaga frappieri]
MSAFADPRVLLAAERTLLAWCRTSLALMMFGFLIERSGLILTLLNPQASSQTIPLFWLGLLFIALGSITSIGAANQFKRVVNACRSAEMVIAYPHYYGITLCLFVALLGGLLTSGLIVYHF